jgi:hypothetical protein
MRSMTDRWMGAPVLPFQWISQRSDRRMTQPNANLLHKLEGDSDND